MKAETDNESRWPLLGIKMPQETKDLIFAAAALEDRSASYWARRELKKAAETAIAQSSAKLEKTTPAPLMMVADEPGETSCPSTPATGAQPVKYQGGRRSRKN